MHKKTKRSVALLCLLLLGAGMAIPVSAGSFVAGVQPDQRPQGAPKLTVMNKDLAWYTQALTGVSEPYPRSLRFLEDQGNWHTPFNRPGMPPPYDIRGWHRQ